MKTALVFSVINVFIFQCYAQPQINPFEKNTEIISNESSLLQEEVCAISTKKNELFVAWVDRKKGTDEKFISYKVSNSNGQKWDSAFSYNPSKYIWTANPTIAEDDNGNLYLVAMSNNYDGKRLPDNGVFEIIRSADGGKTWSGWNTIVESKIRNKDCPDKPSLIAKGNGELYLSYINFNMDSADIFNTHGDVMFTKSLDGGKTWTVPKLVDSGRNWKKTSLLKAIITKEADLGEQGPAMCFYKDQLLISFGSYSGNGIRFSSSTDGGNTFGKARKIIGTKTTVPVTSIVTNGQDKIVILWHNAHSTGTVNYTESKDGGSSWSKNITLANNASILSGALDHDGNMCFLWNEKNDNKVDTKYTQQQKNKLMPLSSFLNDKEAGTQFFIGAYQQFLIDKNSTKHAFWIDWSSAGGRLMHSTWK